MFSRMLQLADILAAKTRTESTSTYLQCLLRQLQPPPEEPLGHLALLGRKEYSRYIGTVQSVSPSSAMENRSCQNLSDDRLSNTYSRMRKSWGRKNRDPSCKSSRHYSVAAVKLLEEDVLHCLMATKTR